jgi:tagatose 6-phosphate kinase
MIGTVTLNAAIDKTVICEEFHTGGITRADEALAVAGGKGINVARTIHRLGGEVVAAGFVGGLNGWIIKRMLEEEGIKHRFVEIEGNSRMCLTIIQRKNLSITEIYDPSPIVQQEDWERCQTLIRQLARKAQIISLNGSLPAGVDDYAYFHLISLIREENPNCKVILDSSGEALRKGIMAKPFMVKPNRNEMEGLFGQPLSDTESLTRAVGVLIRNGISLVVLSLGSDGLMFGFDDSVYIIPPLSTEVVSTVGCGDALVGGIAKKLLESEDIVEAVKYGAASATSNLASKTQGNVLLKQVEEFLGRINMKQIC